MKKSMQLALLMWCLLTVGPAVASIDNQITNWTFRASSDRQRGYKLSVDSDVKFKGSPATFLESTKSHQDIEKFYAAPFQTLKADSFRGKRVDFTGYLRADRVEGAAGLWLNAKSHGKIIAFDFADTNAIKGSADWKKYSLVLDVPERADALTIGVYITGGGKVWFSDLALTPAPKHASAHSRRWDAKRYWRFANELKNAPVNLDFTETGSDVAQLPSWTVRNCKSPSSVGIAREMVYRKKPSAFIQQDSKNPTDFVVSYQDISAADYAGKRVSLSGYVKTRAVTDWAALWLRVDNGRSVLAFDNMEDRPIRGSTDWAHYSVVLDVPANATRIRLGFMLAGSGKSWLNSASFDTVDKSVPVTAKPGKETPLPKHSQPTEAGPELKK